MENICIFDKEHLDCSVDSLETKWESKRIFTSLFINELWTQHKVIWEKELQEEVIQQQWTNDK